MKYTFATNINKSGASGIIDMETLEGICICTKDKAELILKALNKLTVNQLDLQAKELFSRLTDDERMEVLSDYCMYCGKNEKELGKCYCSTCHDE